jgi:UDP-2,3-diacylglucosamine pyrophosphatase LpxH
MDHSNGKKSWFVSDLHLFSRRSSAPFFEELIRSAVIRSHTFVLGGDIFDFRWSTQLSKGQAIDDSIAWLKRLIDTNTDCKFHYLLGNHDCHPEFVEALQRLAETTPQLSWHRHLLRIDQNVFLHGDIVDARVLPGEAHHQILDARRLISENRKPPTALSHAIYDAAIQARVHRLVVQLAKRKELVLQRLTSYLQAHSQDRESGVSQVYFGHTHRKLNAVPYAGMRFYNPGAAIKGLPFQLMEVHSEASLPRNFNPVPSYGSIEGSKRKLLGS